MADINTFDSSILSLLQSKALEIEKEFEGDMIWYSGDIMAGGDVIFRDEIEALQRIPTIHTLTPKRLVVLLTTNGGDPLAVERMVTTSRNFYKEVHFVVPEYAYSAGTLFCMSGEKIFMDYFSSLGPIDPQVQVSGGWVPALGYLDKVNEIIQKSLDGTLSAAEFELLRQQDLAMLRSYEQARDLTVALMTEWLVKYKFKNWKKHQTDKILKGQDVSDIQKQERAKQIARDLGDHQKWHSHARSIDISKLEELRLRIEDYSKDTEKLKVIRDFVSLAKGWSSRISAATFVYTKATYLFNE